MPGLSKKETERLLDHIEPQGVKITPVKNGVMLRLPDGGQQVVHFSVSDHRGPQKLRARLKRAGVTWPTDALNDENRPKPTKRAREIAEQAIANLGHPHAVKAAAFREEVHRLGWENVTNGTIRRMMLYLGYDSFGNTVALEWRKPTPIEIVETPTPEPASNVTPIKPEIETTSEIETTPAEIETPEEIAPTPADDLGGIAMSEEIASLRAEIDRLRVDPASWPIDLDQLPDGMTLLELRLVWAASGLDVEVRVSPRKSAPSSETREDAISEG